MDNTRRMDFSEPVHKDNEKLTILKLMAASHLVFNDQKFSVGCNKHVTVIRWQGHSEAESVSDQILLTKSGTRPVIIWMDFSDNGPTDLESYLRASKKAVRVARLFEVRLSIGDHAHSFTQSTEGQSLLRAESNQG